MCEQQRKKDFFYQKHRFILLVTLSVKTKFVEGIEGLIVGDSLCLVLEHETLSAA